MSLARADRPVGKRRVLLAMDFGGEASERWAGIAQYAREVGWILESRLIAFLATGQHEEYLASIHIDGIISRMQRTNLGLRKIIASANVPVVDLWTAWPELAVPRVLLDYKAGGRMAADHLLDLGIRHVVFYSHTLDHGAADLRRDGCREAAAARGAKVDELWWDSHVPMPDGRGRVGWLATQLKGFAPPLGVMAANDFVASDVVDAADLAGLRIPADVALVGADNDPILTELGTTPLSSVDVARRRLGYLAAQLLDRMIDGEAPPEVPILVAPAGVVVRRSTEVIAVADPDVNGAVRFISEHFREPITVEEVVATTYLSRRRLQDRFLEALGHGMNEEIARQRVQFCKGILLHKSHHKIAAIATMAGFGNVPRMSNVFRREVGMTPHEYRLAYRPADG